MKFLKLLCFGLVVLGISSCGDDSKIENHLSTVKIDLRETHEDLCFMTYNTFLLDVPDTFQGPQCEGQTCIDAALAICAEVEIQMPTVVHLQEVFVDEASLVLKECLENLGYQVEIDENDVNGVGSGLMTASLLPMHNTQLVEFEHSTGVLNDGNDGLADKGFMINQIELEPGCYITSINTHTDAGSDPESRCTRMLQFLQMNEYIESGSGDVPVLLGGDLNLDANGGAEIEIASYIIDFNDNWGGIFGGILNSLFGGNCSDFYNDPEFQDDFIGALEFQVLLELVKGEPVHLVSGDQLAPTASDEQVLDYFIISNMTEAVTNLSIETIESECYLNWVLDRFETDPETGGEIFLGSQNFLSYEEALEAKQECNLSGWSYCRLWSVEICDNPSDHEPVITCFDYNCMDQLTNQPSEEEDDGRNIFDCKPPCDFGTEECINGRCVPI